MANDQYGIEKDGHYFYCLTGGVVYPTLLSGAVLTELLWPDEWSLLNPF
jgi:hypothetical protein